MRPAGEEVLFTSGKDGERLDVAKHRLCQFHCEHIGADSWMLLIFPNVISEAFSK